MQICLPAALFGALVWTYRKKLLPVRVLLLLLLCSTAASGLLGWEMWRNRDSRITSVERNLETDLAVIVPMEVDREGQRYRVSMEVPGHRRTAEEKQALLSAAADGLDALLLGRNRSPEHVEWNLYLPSALEGTGITALWSCDHPEWIGWDGTLGKNIPAEGGQAVLKGTLFLEDQSLEVQRTLTVYPSREVTALSGRLQTAAEERNAGRETEV